MKIKHPFRLAFLFSLALFSGLPAVRGATLVFHTGLVPGVGLRMADSIGVPNEAGGYIFTAGTFDVDPFEGGATALPDLSSFHEFGSALSPGFGASKGLISGPITAMDPTGLFGGKRLYLVVGNEATLASSSLVIVLKSSNDQWRFPDDLSAPVAYTVSLARNAPVSILGGLLTPAPSPEEADVIRPLGWAVPEPGSLGLGVFGLLLAARRSRRA
ncbi:MAG: PEP-CTERM sorting domain-containing protein [Verrucomicrobiota bacterium]